MKQNIEKALEYAKKQNWTDVIEILTKVLESL